MLEIEQYQKLGMFASYSEGKFASESSFCVLFLQEKNRKPVEEIHAVKAFAYLHILISCYNFQNGIII